jgi:hypothetical protein
MKLLVYALCQMLHNHLANLDMTPEDKGCVVATLIHGLIEFNTEPLALHNDKWLRPYKNKNVAPYINYVIIA